MNDMSVSPSRQFLQSDLMRYGLVFAFLIVGIALTASPPLLFGPPIENSMLTFSVYLVISLLWIPAFVMAASLSRRKSKGIPRRVLRGAAVFIVLLLIYVALFLYVFDSSPLRFFLQSPAMDCSTEVQVDGGEAYQCSGALYQYMRIECQLSPIMGCESQLSGSWRVVFRSPEGSFFLWIADVEGPYYY